MRMTKMKLLIPMIASVALCASALLSAGDGGSGSQASRQSSSIAAEARKKQQKPAAEKMTVTINGTIDGEGTFLFQEDKIIYQHRDFEYPTNMTVNGESWGDLYEPFELGFVPVFSTAEMVERSGRNTIHFSAYDDRAELYIFDSASSSSQYRVSIVFEKESSETEDENGDFFISLPGETAKRKGNTPAAGSKEPGENEKLQGVLYTLTPRADVKNSLMVSSGRKNDNDNVIPTLQKFVLGQWHGNTDSSGKKRYPELDQRFDRLSAPAMSCFCRDRVSWENGAEIFNCRDAAGKSGWVSIYSGYVLAPFSGKFRFLGFGDDMMVVRFNRQIVLDYGQTFLSVRLPPNYSMSEFRAALQGDSSLKEAKRLINESPFYSKHKLEISYPDSCDGYGLARSPVLSVQKGQVIPIDILLAEQGEAYFAMVLLIERLDSGGKPLNDPSKSIYPFRTTSEQVESLQDRSLPTFNRDAPIWKVVDVKGNPIPLRNVSKASDKTQK